MSAPYHKPHDNIYIIVINLYKKIITTTITTTIIIITVESIVIIYLYLPLNKAFSAESISSNILVFRLAGMGEVGPKLT